MTLLDPGDITLMHDVVVQLSNATLTRIETPGPLQGNGDPGSLVSAWTGSAQGFLQRQDEDILSGTAEVTVPRTTFRLFDRAGAPVALLRSGADWTAATVVIQDHRLTPPMVRRWSVEAIEHEQDNTLDSVLLTLNADGTTT